MKCTLIYWIDDGWYIGRLKEIPGIATQGETLEELKENIEDAYSNDDGRIYRFPTGKY